MLFVESTVQVYLHHLSLSKGRRTDVILKHEELQEERFFFM